MQFHDLINQIINLKKEYSFYQNSLSGLNESVLMSMVDLKQIPFTTKEDIFNNPDYFNSYFDSMPRCIIPSAGTSGSTFSFRIQYDEVKEELEFAGYFHNILNYWFKEISGKLLIINAYPLGVKIPTSNVTVIPCGPNPEIIKHIYSRFSEFYDSILLICQPHFLKHLVDIGVYKNLDNSSRDKLFFIIGGSWFPKSLKTYFLIKIFNDSELKYGNRIRSTYGLAEFGLGIGIEPQYLIREFLDGEYLPLYYTFPREDIYIELVDNEIVITKIENCGIPLLRYRTGDGARLLNTEENKLLYGTDPEIKTLALTGRLKNNNTEILSKLFSSDFLIECITGGFLLDQSRRNIEIQLLPGVSYDKNIISECERLLSINVTISLFLEFKGYCGYDRKWF
jgi:phenylacetate-coenzyme A ligase PaaK-like adenylate-forming protein